MGRSLPGGRPHPTTAAQPEEDHRPWLTPAPPSRLLAEFHARLCIDAPEPTATAPDDQLARLLNELSESDRLDPHPRSLGAAACLLNLATSDRLTQFFDDDLPRCLDALGRRPHPELLVLVKAAADRTAAAVTGSR
ncbi:hypothetical protein [Streptomyces sp. CBMA152]|uniref:hypothetical protein n=1 Tax=Streptomyces sp. CBMA152 TaxID=1896312 RepID=UPI0016615CD5|nr:hypothetical protein [Streptomyces sp. CBMA152]MBD0741670.1 hypothetical protein [Streptomyces sp. CBMA152]